VAASFELTKRAVPHLLESDRASVINISSRMDRLVARGLLTYGTVKAATSHMTRLLAAELAPRIRVNGTAPGVVATEGLAPRRERVGARYVPALCLSGDSGCLAYGWIEQASPH
jgi:NAD(P)-dependent dehydrogenase (short-subunit alcohol dehydrogenase family)